MMANTYDHPNLENTTEVIQQYIKNTYIQRIYLQIQLLILSTFSLLTFQ